VLYTGQLVPWIQAENLYITVLTTKDGQVPPGLQFQSREWTYVVDLKTMKIVWRGFGSYDGSQPSSAEEGMNQLNTLLGP
jgi:hypothetical protein